VTQLKTDLYNDIQVDLMKEQTDLMKKDKQI